MLKTLRLALSASAMILASCGGGGSASVQAATFTVTFDSHGGSAVASQTVTYGDTATRPTNPTKNGYRFGGWYQDQICETVFDFVNTPITADWTLHAGWIENGGGGSSSSSESTSQGQSSEPTEDKIYFKDAAWWAKDGAYSAIYTWGGSGPAFPGTLMTCEGTRSDSGSNIWSIDASILDGVTGFIFVRVSSELADWGAKTGDLTPSDVTGNLYDIFGTSEVWGNPGVSGTWTTYNG